MEQPRPNDGPETRAAILKTVIQRLSDIGQGLERFGREVAKFDV